MRWLPFLNFFQVAVSVLITLFLIFFPKTYQDHLSINSSEVHENLPKSPFFQTEDAFYAIEDGPFFLNWATPQMHLPNLKNELIFHGINGRPDQGRYQQGFHLVLRESDEVKAVLEGERTYLVYEGGVNFSLQAPSKDQGAYKAQLYWDEPNPGQGHYAFSPDNQPTPLWFELKKGDSDQSVKVSVGMLDDKGVLIKSPPEYQFFTLAAHDQKRNLSAWELGKFRVDSTLLVRQKARWIGKDRFLELHGGEDFEEVLERERIDFFYDDSPYSCFVKKGDYLIWEDNQWKNVFRGKSTRGHPLLVVNKIEDKIMTFELWDPEGKVKTFLSLVRLKNHADFPDISREFKFVGAKTWAQFIIETRSGRMTLKPNDWLVLKDGEWIKLDSPEQIDEYVDQKLIGPLFILDKLSKKNGKQVLAGHVFNSSRTYLEEFELIAETSSPMLVNDDHPPLQDAAKYNNPFDLTERKE